MTNTMWFIFYLFLFLDFMLLQAVLFYAVYRAIKAGIRHE